MSARSTESEVRRLLSMAWNRVRRKARPADVRPALHLNLNDEFRERREGVAKYFFATLIVFALVYLVSSCAGPI
jgi:hypothetical protein